MKAKHARVHIASRYVDFISGLAQSNWKHKSLKGVTETIITYGDKKWKSYLDHSSYLDDQRQVDSKPAGQPEHASLNQRQLIAL